MHNTLITTTKRIVDRSEALRQAYLESISTLKERGKSVNISCSNLAHATASMPEKEKGFMIESRRLNIGIISAYNDMLSAHKPYETYPNLIRESARRNFATAQVAGAVPAMCDGITQGREGMNLSLFSRDVIAMSTAIGLSHDVFDAAVMLGICDKIVPGLLIGALQFGHLPTIFIPAGPMVSGLANADKKRIRQDFVEKKVGRKELLQAEMKAYHAPGTCTFYGTANSNQMLLEAMGLHRPNHAFINPGDSMRAHLVEDAVSQLITTLRSESNSLGIGYQIDAKVLVNALVVLLASGGSTNHTIHWIAVAKAAGFIITWEDIAELSSLVPLICKIYPNGTADVNDFQQAGGPAVVIKQLLDAGLLHEDVHTVNGYGLENQCKTPTLDEQGILCYKRVRKSLNPDVISSCEQPFHRNGGITLVTGNIGRAIVKTSALTQEELAINAQARVFNSQEAVVQAYDEGVLNTSMVVVVRNQSPQDNGMPELHRLMPILSSISSQGHQVALLTDGRLSGASGQVLAAIHLVSGKEDFLYKIEDGDQITIDCAKGLLTLDVDEQILQKRVIASRVAPNRGFSTTLFEQFRQKVTPADEGASIW